MHTHKNFSVSGDPTNIYNAYKKKFNVLSLCLAGSIFFPTIEKEKTAFKHFYPWSGPSERSAKLFAFKRANINFHKFHIPSIHFFIFFKISHEYSCMRKT